MESLKHHHSSKPRNPIIADVCFKGGLIDSWGRGTIKIIETCKEAELPEPELKERDGGFMVTLFKNKLTEENLIKLDLNERQIKAIEYVQKNSRISNKEYQIINDTSQRTASRDLSDLIDKQVFQGSGVKGAGAYYTVI